MYILFQLHVYITVGCFTICDDENVRIQYSNFMLTSIKVKREIEIQIAGNTLAIVVLPLIK